MSKTPPNRKLLLVAFNTDREVNGEMARVKFKSGSVIDLTPSELTTLTNLQNKTGKLHYRDPIQEGGAAAASEPEVVDVPDYAGQDTPMDKKNVDLLKAYLTFHSVEFEADAKKPDLLKLATAHEAGQTDDKSGGSTASGAADPDAGL